MNGEALSDESLVSISCRVRLTPAISCSVDLTGDEVLHPITCLGEDLTSFFVVEHFPLLPYRYRLDFSGAKTSGELSFLACISSLALSIWRELCTMRLLHS